MKTVGLLLVLTLASCATVDQTTEKPEMAQRETEVVAMETQDDIIDIAGAWKGDLMAGARKIPLVFRVTADKAGGFSATLDSPSEGAIGIPIEAVTVDGNSVLFDIAVASAKFEAVFDEVSERLTGNWIQGSANLPLVVNRSDDTEIPAKPQDPIPPYPYNSADVAFTNDAAGITLRGTITYPDGPGPFPGVILISGSGQQDRNESIFGHKPFLVLADALTRSGIAVLRYDDRGAGESEGADLVAGSISEDLAGDALSAHSYLLSLPGIDTENVGMVGHSEGGLIAPLLASSHPEIGFIVLLAGPGIQGDKLIASQSVEILRASGMSEELIQATDDANRKIYQTILDTPDNDTAMAAISPIMKDFGLSQEQIDAQLPVLLSPWYRYFLAYDPIPALESLDIPVLALNGTLDLQVPYKANLEAIGQALDAAPTTEYHVEALTDLNHLFQTASTGLVSEYGQIEETFAPVALELITSWIVEVTR